MSDRMRLTLADFTHDRWTRAASIIAKPGVKTKFVWKCYRSDFRTAHQRGWIEIRSMPTGKPHVKHLEARFSERVERRDAAA